MNRYLERVKAGLSWRALAAINKLVSAAAPVWRDLLRRTTFIGVTGSGGKTTTKELLVGILGSAYRGTGNFGTENDRLDVPRNLLRARLADDFCVMEFSCYELGFMDWMMALIRPQIGIVTMVRDDHWALYRSREAIAQEKSKLVRGLPSNGTAVLNADDPLVRDMTKACTCKVLTFGSAVDADVRLVQAEAVWPQRLKLLVRYQAQQVHVETQLCGLHWTSAALAAIAGAIAYGMTLQQCVQAMKRIPPFAARMQPVTTPKGATFIRDDWKAPLWTVEPGLQFVEQARAKRKIVVIGTISDYNGDASAQYARIAKRSQEIADVTIFVGPWASRALRARRPGREEALRVFSNVHAASVFINSIVQAGDLIWLKGTAKQDHLSRIMHDSFGEVACWRDDCKINLLCEECELRMKPSGHGEDAPPVPLPPALKGFASPDEQPDDPRLFVCGLGNLGEQYANTPHNVGMAVVDRLAHDCGAEWTQTRHAMVAQARWHGHDVVLLKLLSPMNQSGPALRAALQDLDADFKRCVLVHDDLDLPLGTVRGRMRSSAGGHRGVASILEAFQSDQLKRVKMGVGVTGYELDPQQYVLTPWSDAHRATVEAAIPEAVSRIKAMTRDCFRSEG
jgi:UDP-N-acetylmuramoyl-tripeptide--D-alanyl-D-alanine ligase